jgi:hypothetical protein
MWPRPLRGQRAWVPGHGSSRELISDHEARERKVDRPMACGILCSCFFAEFGFRRGR